MSKMIPAGIVTAYGAAVRGGYQGTYEEFCAALGGLTKVLEDFEGFQVEVTTLEPGEPATADYSDGVLTLGIPEGETGNGIQSAELNQNYTLTLTWTNGQSTTVGPIRGATGQTPNLTIGTVETLDPDESATATITGTPEDPVLNLGIPKGESGGGDAGDITFDPEEDYDEGTVGKALKDELNAIFNSADVTWEQGGVVLASGQLETNPKRCRTNRFFLRKGATFTVTPNGLWYNFAKYKADDNSYLAYKSTWTSDNVASTYRVDYDAYIIVWLRNSDNTDIAPTDVTTTVIYENDLINETIDDVEAIQADLPKASVRMEVYPASGGLDFSGNLTVNDPLICTVNSIFYFRNTDNLGGVCYLNRQGGAFSIANGKGLFFDFTARTLEVIGTDAYVPPNKLLLLGKEGKTINGLWAIYYYRKAQYVNAQGQTVWTVGTEYIPTIQAACDLAADGDIIYVKCGTYTEQVSIWTRELHIIGEDKVNTILIDHSGNYDTPPLEMAMGSLSNMTIIEDGTAPTVEPSDEHYMMAYCLHIEHPNATGKTFVIDNCDFINDIHTPLGCGMRANNTVHFRNCTFRCNATSESTSAERGAFFVHAQNKENIENQNVIIENCIISSAGPRLAVQFGVPANANNTGSMFIRMSNCTVWNENRGIADNAVCWDTSGGTDVMSMVHSYGNTIARLNTTTDATNYVTLSGTIVTQTGADNTMYLCGELAELTFTAPQTGQTAIRFTSGTTPTVATFTGVTWLNGFDPTAIEASKTYEVNILNGLGCAAWT